MQQQLIEGLIVDHLETSSRRGGGNSSRNHVTYDQCGRKVITVTDGKKSGRDKPHLCLSPRTPKHPAMHPNQAKRLIQNVCRDLQDEHSEVHLPTTPRSIHTAPSPQVCRPTQPARPTTSGQASHVEAFPALVQSPRRAKRSEPIVDHSMDTPMQSPLHTWGIPREHILEFIRLSVLPSTWAMNIKSVGEWRAMSNDPNGASQLPRLVKPRLQFPPQLTAKQSKSNRGQRRPRPQHIVLDHSLPPPPPPPSVRDNSIEAKIHKMIADLKQDPHAWQLFQQRIQEYKEMKKQNSGGSGGNGLSIIDQNKRNAFVVSTASDLAERKRQHDEQLAAIKKKHQMQLEEERIFRMEQLDRRARKLHEQRRHVALETQVKGWLRVVVTVCVVENWHDRMRREKKRKLIELKEHAAACRIQRVWRYKLHVTNSKAMLQIILKTRQILWSLTFKASLHCKKMAKGGNVLRRFMLDYFNGNSETGNFRVMMARWRWRVIHAQRVSKAFLSCGRARLAVLSQMWDNADRDRQRMEKLHLQQNKTVVSDETPAAATARRVRAGDDTIGDMAQQLSAMQTMLTPIEFQRMQMHANHVVRIPKSIKMKLLVQYLSKRRAQHVVDVKEYIARAMASSNTRQVRVSDALAIVQTGAWIANVAEKPSQRKSSKLDYPVFQLYSKATADDMKTLIQEGIRLTLEQDPEQRRLVETQRQGAMEGSPFKRRLSVFAGGKPVRKDPLLGKLLDSERQNVIDIKSKNK
ncbi:hypothetical protein AeRB84_018902 [Aphanomyces euteiches]|nr:hypothetical protein AeRB84_018902 [Aphanomyces euteiches]